MDQKNSLLSSSELKDRAKGALNKKYGTFILAFIIINAISFGCQLLLTLCDSFLFGIILVMKELFTGSLSIEEIQQLGSDPSYIMNYMGYYTIFDYVLQMILCIFTTVFSIGLGLLCLNTACGRNLKISDMFYGFSHNFFKSIKLTALLVAVSQVYNIPLNIIVYMVQYDDYMEYLHLILLLLITGVIIYVPISLNLSQILFLTLDFPDLSAGEIIRQSINIMKGHKHRLFYIQLSFIPLMIINIFTFGIGGLWLTPYFNVTYALFFLNLMQTRTSTD